MQFSFILVDDSDDFETTLEHLKPFSEFLCVAVCHTKKDGIDKILELKPTVVFLSINKSNASQDSIPFSLLSELHEYLEELPTVIVLSNVKETAYEAYQRGVTGFVLKPIDPNQLRRCLLRFQKTHKALFADKISIKSNGDYNFIKFHDIIYLKADSNTTDFYLQSGKVISGFKTMKYFEGQLPFYFFRVHNSYIVNIKFVTRINLGKFDCFLFDNMYKIPFSRTYRDNIDAIIKRIGKI